MSKQAIVIGIDNYKSAQPLSGCVEDAHRISELLELNEDGQRNMDVLLRTCGNTDSVSKRSLMVDVAKMFGNNGLQLAVLYFAGHGYVDKITGEGYLVTYDGGNNAMDWGLPLSTLLKLANRSKAHAKLIILDCCHSGSMGQLSSHETINEPSLLAEGVTIITASKEDEVAMEYGAHGLFTSLLIDGLQGAAADLKGKITPAALYTMIDQSLASHEQRPLYKANVQSQFELRRTKPLIRVEILRKLFAEYFTEGSDKTYVLGPEHEPDRGELTEKYKDIQVDAAKVAAYRDLQVCAKQGLVEPVEQPYMWHAAMNRTGCKLTALGRYYWKLGKRGRL